MGLVAEKCIATLRGFREEYFDKTKGLEQYPDNRLFSSGKNHN